MYFYLNTEVFTDPKDNLVSDDIIETFKNIIDLIKKLDDYDSDLIFNKDFLYFEIDGENIYTFLERNFDEDEVRLITNRLDMQCANSQCADLLEDYLDEDLEIKYNNCKDLITGEDIFGTALACSLFNEIPIITPDKLCKEDHHFLTDEINIIEKKEDSDNLNHVVKNIKLSNYMTIISDFKDDKYKIPPSWNEYIDNTKNQLKHVLFTKSCIKDFNKNSNINSKYITLIREHIEKLNKFVIDNGDDPKKCANITSSGVKAREESSSRLTDLADKLKKKNCCGDKYVMTWHSRIDYYRLYFTCNYDNKMCFTFFTKKIPNKGS